MFCRVVPTLWPHDRLGHQQSVVSGEGMAATSKEFDQASLESISGQYFHLESLHWLDCQSLRDWSGRNNFCKQSQACKVTSMKFTHQHVFLMTGSDGLIVLD